MGRTQNEEPQDFLPHPVSAVLFLCFISNLSSA